VKLIRYNDGRVGVVRSDIVYDISSIVGDDSTAWPPVSMNRLIAAFDECRPEIEKAVSGSAGINISEVHLLTPVPWPNKLMPYPVNYIDHAKEMNSVGYADVQGYFLKANSSLCGASDNIVLPSSHGTD
jgi:2-keto-4-pentenoate hydratase/2-oxohepta-3-ene-1,7-dioic acid hydratase in catechol pathway